MSGFNIKKFNGKLLITGEYLVLDGAHALAVPTRFGQTFEVQTSDHKEDLLLWESLDMYGHIWFEGAFDKDTREWSVFSPEKNKLGQLLSAAINQNPDRWNNIKKIQSSIDFPMNWGLGTSSTLVAGVADIAGIDPYFLNELVFGGSGYDIACASAEVPILFKKLPTGRDINSSNFFPEKAENCYFVFLGNKQNSRDSIAYYRTLNSPKPDLIDRISEISDVISNGVDHLLLISLLKEHESIMAEFLNLKHLESRVFNNFPGVVKSLGAWGGDFCLAIFESNPVPEYFYELGYSTVIPYSKMVKKAGMPLI